MAVNLSRSRTSLTRMRNGGISFWHRQIGIPPPRAPLDGSRAADVVIAGGGYTGLWTAYYLKRARPELEIVVLEREFCGFGASGRNGGWVSSAFAGSREQLARTHGRDRVVALQRQMQATVDEVLALALTGPLTPIEWRESDQPAAPQHRRRLRNRRTVCNIFFDLPYDSDHQALG